MASPIEFISNDATQHIVLNGSEIESARHICITDQNYVEITFKSGNTITFHFNNAIDCHNLLDDIVGGM